MRSEGFFTYSRGAYTNFLHEERKMRRLFFARRAYSTHFTRRVVKNTIICIRRAYSQSINNIFFVSVLTHNPHFSELSMSNTMFTLISLRIIFCYLKLSSLANLHIDPTFSLRQSKVESFNYLYLP